MPELSHFLPNPAINVETAAFQVCYESPSQFCRANVRVCLGCLLVAPPSFREAAGPEVAVLCKVMNCEPAVLTIDSSSVVPSQLGKSRDIPSSAYCFDQQHVCFEPPSHQVDVISLVCKSGGL